MADSVEVIIGRIGRAHGVRGELSVEVLTDEPERRFATDAAVREEGGRRRTWHIAASRRHQGRLLVRLAEVAERTVAETLRGVVLVAEVPADESPTDAEEYYDRQLVGLRVLDHTGTEAAVVTAVVHQAQDLIEVRTRTGEQRLIPFVAALVPHVDLDAGTLTVAEVSGLLEDADEPEESAPKQEGQR